MAWTTPSTSSVGQVLTSSRWNTEVRDNLTYLKGDAGAVQVDDSFSLVKNTTGTLGLTVSNANGGASGYAAISVNTDSGSTAGFLRNSSTQTAYAGANSLNIWTLTTHNIGFVTNNALRMIVSGSGAVGIGTGTPTALALLDVAGNINMPTNGYLLWNGSSAVSIQGLGSGLYFSAGALGFQFVATSGNLVFNVAALSIQVAGTASIGSSGSSLGFFGSSGAVRQTGGAATAGATYTANEQSMLQKAYNALRSYNLLS